MSSIDQRVVQMEFDNKQFEKGIQTTLKSLEELQKGLDLKGATDGIKNIEKSVNNMDVSGIGKTVETIANHFSWLGRTVDHTIDNLTSRVISAGTQMVKSLSVGQISSGWSKYEDTTKAVGTIMSATGDSIETVYNQLDKLNWYTDETSYSFTDMVRNIASFTSVGVGLEDATTAMIGIANATGLAGKGVNEAQRAMYNFSQAMGMGVLQLADWKSIELAGLNTKEFQQELVKSGVALGTLVKQGENYISTTKSGTGQTATFSESLQGFRNSLSAGWITTDVMLDTFKRFGTYSDEIYKIVQEEGIPAAQAMEKFSGAVDEVSEKGFKASQEARTLTDAIEAVKDAVSSGWKNTFQIIFGQYDTAKNLWTDLTNVMWEVFAGGAEARNEMLSQVFESQDSKLKRKDWLDLYKQGIADDTLQKAITDAARNHGIAIDEMIEKDGSFYDSLKENWLTVDILNEALDTTKKSAEGAGSGIQNTTDRLKELEGVAKRVIQGDFGNGEDRMRALAEAGYDYAEVQGLVNKILKGGEVSLEDLSDAELKQIGYTQEEIDQLNKLKKQAEETGTPLNELMERLSKPSGRELMIQSASNAFEALMRVIRAVKDAWKDIFPPMTADRLYSVLEGIRDFTANLILSSDNAQRFRRIFSGIFASFDIFGQVAMSVAKSFLAVGRSLLPVGEIILEGAAKVGDAIRSLSKGLRESGVFDTIATNVSHTLGLFTAKIRAIFVRLKKALGIGDIFKPVKDAWGRFGDWIDSKGGINGIVQTFFDRINEFIRGIKVGKVTLAITKFIDKVKKAFSSLSGIKDFIAKAFGSIFSFIQGLGSKTTSALEVGKGGSFIDQIVDILGKPFEFIGTVGEKIKPVLTTLGGILETGFDGIQTGLSFGLDAIKKYLVPLVDLFRNIAFVKALFNINKVIDGFGGIFSGVSGILSSASNVIDSVADGIKTITSAKAKDLKANSFLKVAAAIGILVAAVFVLTKLDPNELYNALTMIGVLFAELAGGLFLFNKALGGNAAGGVKKIGGFLSLALGVLVFINVMQKLLKMKISDIAVALGELFGILVVLAGFSRLADNEFKASNGAALLMTALSLQAFILAMLELAKMKPETILKGLVGLGLIFLELAAFMKLANKKFRFRNGMGLLMTAIALQGFVLAILEIGKMKPEQALGGIIALGAIMLELGVFMRLASGKKFKFTKGMGILAIAASMLLFADALKKLGSIKTGTLIKGLISMEIVFLELKGLMGSAEGMSLGAGTGFGIVMLSLFTLIPLLKELSKLPNIEKVGIGFGAALAGLGIGLKALSGIGIKGGLAAGGSLASFSLIVGAVIAVVEAIAGGLSKIKGIEGFLSGATSVLTEIGNGIGGFIGGIVGGIVGGTMAGVSSGLSSLGTSLSDFWTNASGFIEGVKTINADTVSGIGYLASAILKLTGGELVDALVGWITKGESNLTTFGLELANAAPYIATFGNVVGSVNKETMQNAVDAITALATIEIPRSGGWLQTVIGEKNFSSFGQNLADLAPNLVDFSTKAAGVNVKNVQNGAKALEALASVDVPLTGGWLQHVIGEESLGAFGVNLKLLGSGIADFASAVEGVTADQVSVIPSIVPALQSLANMDVSNTGGAFQWLVGVNDLGNFGEDMTTLGTGIQGFSAAIANVDVLQLAGVVNQLQALSDFSATLNGNLTASIGDFATAMEVLGGINFDPLLTSFADYSTDFASSGQSLAQALVGGITEILYDATSPINALNAIIASMQTAVQGSTQSYFQIGQTLVTNLSGGITDQTYLFHTKILDLITNGLSAINATKANFNRSGQNLAAGIVEGMKSKVNDVTNAAKMLAHAANQAFRSASDINSPSRVMMKNGAYWVEGFVRGLQNGTNSAEEAAANIGVVSADALQSAMAMVSAMMNSEGDLSPTIRPVLDLSAVQSGAGQISSIFGQSQTIGLGGFQNPFIPKTLDTISSQMSPLGGETVTTDNDDVVMAIQTLGDQFETLKEAVASMKLVMETGAVVGQIKYEIDRQLGRMAELKERGI